MKMYAICLVKNEDDIIGQTLTFATGYCDKIFVINNSSMDDSPRIVQSLIYENEKIVAFEVDNNRTHRDSANGYISPHAFEATQFA